MSFDVSKCQHVPLGLGVASTLTKPDCDGITFELSHVEEVSDVGVSVQVARVITQAFPHVGYKKNEFRSHEAGDLCLCLHVLFQRERKEDQSPPTGSHDNDPWLPAIVLRRLNRH